MLTQETLNSVAPFTLLGTGIITDQRLFNEPIRWCAVRGGIGDWAIYYHKADRSIDFVMSNGDKCITKELIRELVPCTDEAFKNYRY